MGSVGCFLRARCWNWGLKSGSRSDCPDRQAPGSRAQTSEIVGGESGNIIGRIQLSTMRWTLARTLSLRRQLLVCKMNLGANNIILQANTTNACGHNKTLCLLTMNVWAHTILVSATTKALCARNIVVRARTKVLRARTKALCVRKTLLWAHTIDVRAPHVECGASAYFAYTVSRHRTRIFSDVFADRLSDGCRGQMEVIVSRLVLWLRGHRRRDRILRDRFGCRRTSRTNTLVFRIWRSYPANSQPRLVLSAAEVRSITILGF